MLMGALTVAKESVIPATREEWLGLRTRDITSTECAALFGISPYITLFELWHRKRDGSVVEIQASDRMKWGTRLQDSIALGLGEDHGLTVAKRPQYERLPDLRLGASYDFTVMGPAGDEEAILEVKNVDRYVAAEGWLTEGDDVEAPPHIELQVQHQLLVSGLRYAYIGALVGGNRAVLIRRERAEDVIAGIKAKAAEFWASIAAGKAPEPDFERDAAYIKSLYQTVRPGTVLDATSDAELATLAAQYKDAKASVDAAAKAVEGIKAQMLTRIGDAEKVLGIGWSISAGIVKGAHIEAHDRPAYRAIRVNLKK